MNWARPYLDPRTELLALVDADYQVDPQWLAHTVGFFDDPKFGFVQCPQAYRDFRHSAYGVMANAGYDWAHVTEKVSRFEQGAAISMGTMGLIRLEALDTVGGWAEWCKTEDSEFAIRVHAAGYTSVFLRRAYGWGLIPETLAELKKQRFRWTYGPGQEFKAHWRLYVPGRLGVRSALDRRQRVRHAHTGLVILVNGLRTFTVPIGMTIMALMFLRQEAPALAPVFLLPVGAILATRAVMRWTLYKAAAGMSFGEFVGGSMALLAVRTTVSVAAFSTLIGRPALWRRTNKFQTVPTRFQFLRESRLESILALGCLVMAVATPVVMPVNAATILFTAGLAWHAFGYACAPLLAFLAQRDLRTPAPPPAPSLEDRRPVAAGGR
jgi:cellulose synthase/poly-beta-1,6-N-acetylglucosamine synthase-like glycosyltransferase